METSSSSPTGIFFLQQLPPPYRTILIDIFNFCSTIRDDSFPIPPLISLVKKDVERENEEESVKTLNVSGTLDVLRYLATFFRYCMYKILQMVFFKL